MVNAQTKLVGLIGHPVSHSLSPQLHGAAIDALGLNAVYLAFDIDPKDVASALDGLFKAGVVGLNATIPHKKAAYDFAQEHTDVAKKVGVANTLYRDGNTIVADNTDVLALEKVLSEFNVTEGYEVTVFGAGGVARAVAVAAGSLGASLKCVARRDGQAQMIEELAQSYGGTAVHRGTGKLLINATPLGRHGESLPDELMTTTGVEGKLDLNYGGLSPFLQTAFKQDLLYANGSKMLVLQAEIAFERWFNEQPPKGLMSEIAHRL